MSEQPEQFEAEYEEAADLYCHVGERYPSHRAHSAAAQEQVKQHISLTALLTSVDSDLS